MKTTTIAAAAAAATTTTTTTTTTGKFVERFRRLKAFYNLK